MAVNNNSFCGARTFGQTFTGLMRRINALKEKSAEIKTGGAKSTFIGASSTRLWFDATGNWSMLSCAFDGTSPKIHGWVGSEWFVPLTNSGLARQVGGNTGWTAQYEKSLTNSIGTQTMDMTAAVPESSGSSVTISAVNGFRAIDNGNCYTNDTNGKEYNSSGTLVKTYTGIDLSLISYPTSWTDAGFDPNTPAVNATGWANGAPHYMAAVDQSGRRWVKRECTLIAANTDVVYAAYDSDGNVDAQFTANVDVSPDHKLYANGSDLYFIDSSNDVTTILLSDGTTPDVATHTYPDALKYMEATFPIYRNGNTLVNLENDGVYEFFKCLDPVATPNYESLGEPDGGSAVPVLDGIDLLTIHPEYIAMLRNALLMLMETGGTIALDSDNLFPWINPATSKPYHWNDADPDNLYFVAMGDRTDYGATGGAAYGFTNTMYLGGQGVTTGIDPAELELPEANVKTFATAATDAGQANTQDFRLSLMTPVYDIDIGEIEECVATLEASDPVWVATEA